MQPQIRSCSRGYVKHPAVYQTHRPDSHFQNADTWAELITKFRAKVDEIRSQINALHTPALLLIDAAGQHVETKALLRAHNIDVVDIPPSCTHVFQPADMYIISNIKKHIDAGWGQYIKKTWQNSTMEDAVNTMCDSVVGGRKKLPYQRDLKMALVCHALNTLGADSIVASWEATGITRALYLVTPKRGVFYDTYVEIERLATEGEDVEDHLLVAPDSGPLLGDTPSIEIPIEDNYIAEHVPTQRRPQVAQRVVRPVGRPPLVGRDQPVQGQRSVLALLGSMKRQREDDVQEIPPTDDNDQ